MRGVHYKTGVEFLGTIRGYNVWYCAAYQTYNVSKDDPATDIIFPEDQSESAGYYDPAGILKLKGIPDNEIREFKKRNRIKLDSGERY